MFALLALNEVATEELKSPVTVDTLALNEVIFALLALTDVANAPLTTFNDEDTEELNELTSASVAYVVFKEELQLSKFTNLLSNEELNVVYPVVELNVI
jgi:hypothetical protein